MFLISYSIAMVMQIFTPNYFATNVIENCGLLPHRLFSSHWFELENIEQKGSLLFMRRTVRPLAIRAGSLYQMNINTFLKVEFDIFHIIIRLNSFSKNEPANTWRRLINCIHSFYLHFSFFRL